MISFLSKSSRTKKSVKIFCLCALYAVVLLVGSRPAFCQTENYDSVVAETVEQIKVGKMTEAQTLARKLVMLDTARYEGHLYLGITFFNQNDYDAAEAELTKALSHVPEGSKGQVQSALNRTRNTRTYVTALAEADAAFKDGLKAKAAKKYAEAARALPAHMDIALKAARLFADVDDYVEAASLAAAARDAAEDGPQSEAGRLVEEWRPKFETQAKEQFTSGLKQLQAGTTEPAISTLEKYAPLLANREEGMLTLAFAYYAAGDKARTLDLLKRWIRLDGHKVENIAFMPIAATYSPDLVGRAIADPEINTLLTDTFGEKPVTLLSRDVAANGLSSKLPTTKINPIDGAEMVLIPAGPFQFGYPCTVLNIRAYYIYKNDVTVAMYRKFCKATKHEMPKKPDWGWQDNYPMVDVSRDDAKAYCVWAGTRLPSIQQWEKAARGVDGRLYPWGNQFDHSRLCCGVDRDYLYKPSPVGSFPTGASPYGILDMAGNVKQWCSGQRRLQDSTDWPDDLTSGSSFSNNYSDQNYNICSFEHSTRGSAGFYDVGFRCAAP